LRGVALTKKHEREFEKPKWRCDGFFLPIVRVYRDLVISTNDFDGREYHAGSYVLG